MIETVQAIEILEGGRWCQSLPTEAQRPTVAELEARDAIVAKTLKAAAFVVGFYGLWAAFTAILLAVTGHL